nr:hypothetical protein [Tanacetum cinerariifolium]
MIYLSQEVTHLEVMRTAQVKEIASLKKKVTKMEQIHSLRISGFHPFKAEEDADTEMIFEDKGNSEKGGSTAEAVSTARSDINAARPEVSTAEPKTPPTTATLFDDEDVTIVNTLAALAEIYDEVQAQIDDDHELAIRWTHEEQEKYTVKERSKLFEGYVISTNKQEMDGGITSRKSQGRSKENSCEIETKKVHLQGKMEN